MRSKKQNHALTAFTIGHSTHSLEEFVSMLKAHGVAQLVDVRTVPKSRRVPQFNSESLAVDLPAQGIDYVHLKALGGLRRAKKIPPTRGGATLPFADTPTTWPPRSFSTESRNCWS
jgi:Protein of unknown function, DUF488